MEQETLGTICLPIKCPQCGKAFFKKSLLKKKSIFAYLDQDEIVCSNCHYKIILKKDKQICN